MKYLATYYVDREDRSRTFSSLGQAVRFICRGMGDGSLWPGEVMDLRGRTVVSHERIMDSWLDVVTGDVEPADLASD